MKRIIIPGQNVQILKGNDKKKNLNIYALSIFSYVTDNKQDTIMLFTDISIFKVINVYLKVLFIYMLG